MANGRWVAMEFHDQRGLARLTLEDPYHAVPYREPYSWLRRGGPGDEFIFPAVSPQASEMRTEALAD
eukprot:2758473-Alexandrium_andersonii.AAC.1